jgi:SecD/SecF fusion protein
VTRPPVLRAVLALLILGLSTFSSSSASPGWASTCGAAPPSPSRPRTRAPPRPTRGDRPALEVLRRRVDALGVAEPTLARSGERRIIVELPGVQDAAAAADAIGQTAQLTFHPVLGPGDPSQVVGPIPSQEPLPLLTAAPSAAPAPSRRPRGVGGPVGRRRRAGTERCRPRNGP